MQLVFKKIRWRNFLSTGNVFTEIDLTKSPDTLIIGENGAGKSTLIDALTFACYNKPFRDVGKPNLLNSINDKDGVVELELKSGGVDYKIVRGIKPNTFEIYQSGILVKQDAAVKDYQTWLETHVLKMNFKAFSQIVVLGSDSYIPFMRLKQARRREVIEEILDIRIFSAMNQILKRKLQVNKEQLETNRLELTVLEERLNSLSKHQKEIQSDKEERKTSCETEIKESQNMISFLEELIETNDKEVAEIKEYTKDYKKHEAKLKELNDLRIQITARRNKLNKENKFFEDNTQCPTCEQQIEEIFKDGKITKNINTIAECDSGLASLQKVIDDVTLTIKCLDEELNDLRMRNTESEKHRTKIAGHREYIKKMEKSIKEIDAAQTKTFNGTALSDCTSEIDKTKTARNELIDTRKYYDFGFTMLRDDGVKTREIRRYLPLINTQINKHLQDMDCYVNFTLDESFEESIKSRHRDKFTYNSFSAGERLRIDLALLFTWRDVAARKNSIHTNLLIMDEVFDSSLDSQGTEEFLKLIGTLGTNTNIFVISHRNEFLFDKFKSVIKFVKTKNFSQIE